MKTPNFTNPCARRVICSSPSVSRRAPGRVCSPGLAEALDGPRPSATIVMRLKAGLAAEAHALGDLRQAREQVRAALVDARGQGVGYFALAAAVVPATGSIADTTRRRRLLAASLKQRLFEARCRRVA